MKTEHLKALHEQRESISAQLADLESRLDEIDAEIARNTPPPDVSKMTELERVAYEDGQRMRRHIIQKLTTEKSPFVNLLDGGTFPHSS